MDEPGLKRGFRIASDFDAFVSGEHPAAYAAAHAAQRVGETGVSLS